MDDTTRLWLEEHDPSHLYDVAEANKKLFASGYALGRAHKALEQIRQWCGAYATDTAKLNEIDKIAREALDE